MRRTTLFSKRPVPGAVKTRLVPPLSEGQAAALQEAMLGDIAARCVGREEFATALRFAPAEADDWYRRRLPEIVDQAPQSGRGLGERLARHFEGAFLAFTTEVVIGTDAPLLSTATIVEAHEALEGGADLVLSIDGGGGYTLVGLRAPCSELFSEVCMSTPDMARRTLELARELGLAVTQVAPSHDVDRWSDLERLISELHELGPDHSEFPTRTAATLRTILSDLRT